MVTHAVIAKMVAAANIFLAPGDFAVIYFEGRRPILEVLRRR